MVDSTHGDIAKSIRFVGYGYAIDRSLPVILKAQVRLLEIDGDKFKELCSASEYQKGCLQKCWRQKNLPTQLKVIYRILWLEMEQDLQSSISYAGGRDLYQFGLEGLCYR